MSTCVIETDISSFQPKIPPKLTFKPQAKNNGVISAYSIITPQAEDAGAADLSLYEAKESTQAALEFDPTTSPGQGIRFDTGDATTSYGWFMWVYSWRRNAIHRGSD